MITGRLKETCEKKLVHSLQPQLANALRANDSASIIRRIGAGSRELRHRRRHRRHCDVPIWSGGGDLRRCSLSSLSRSCGERNERKPLVSITHQILCKAPRANRWAPRQVFVCLSSTLRRKPLQSIDWQKTAARNRRHKVFDRRVGILKFDEISTDLYCFIFQFRGGWIFVWGAKPTIAPSWRRDCITNQKHEENVRDENSVDSQLADSIFKWCLSAGYDVIARWSRSNFVHQNVRASPAVLSDLFQQVQQIFVVDVITFANVSDILNLFQVLPTYIYNPSHFVLKTIRQK